MDRHILGSDGQAQARAAGRACTCGVGSVETVEHVVGDLLGHADAPVAYAAGHVGVTRSHGDRHICPIGVFDRVDNQVADDAFDAALVDLGGGAAGGIDYHRDALPLRQFRAAFHDAGDDGAQVVFFGIEQGARRIVA